MRIPTKAELESLRKRYPIGCRVRLVEMDDKQAPPVGTMGIVQGVDDMGDLLVDWDNGSSLSVVLGIDAVQTVKDGQE